MHHRYVWNDSEERLGEIRVLCQGVHHFLHTPTNRALEILVIIRCRIFYLPVCYQKI